MLTFLGWYSLVILILTQLINIGSNRVENGVKVGSVILSVPMIIYILY